MRWTNRWKSASFKVEKLSECVCVWIRVIDSAISSIPVAVWLFSGLTSLHLRMYAHCTVHKHVKYKCHVLFKINWMTIVINVLLWAYSSIIRKKGGPFRSLFFSCPTVFVHASIPIVIIISNISPFSHNKRSILCLPSAFSFSSVCCQDVKWCNLNG